MINIRIDNQAYAVPGDWNEMTKEQFIALIRICMDENRTYIEIQLKFFLYCVYGSVRTDLGAGLYEIKTRASRHALFADELAAVLMAFDYLFEVKADGSRELSPKLVINHFKSVQCGCRFLHGPNDALDNITYDEFVWLQTWQSQLNDNPGALDEFINIIYKDRGGNRSLALVRRMSQTAKTGILWFYLGTMHFLEEKFPHVFSGSGNANVNVFDNQQRIIDSLAEGDVTKKMQVRESLLYDALYSMEMAALRIEEMERESRKKI